MKKNLALIFLILPLFLFSQIQWQAGGVPVNCGDNIYWAGSSVQFPNGNTVYVWSDNRNGDRGIFAQQVTPDGELLWGEGLLVVDEEGPQHYPAITLTSDDNILISWLHYLNDFDKEIRAQKIDQSGFKLWAEEGSLIFADTDIGMNFRLVSDDTGGAFIFWQNFNYILDPGFVKTLHVLSSGDIETNWNLNDNLLLSNTRNLANIVPDNSGGFVIAWINDMGNLLAQRSDSNGNILWGEDGNVVETGLAINSHPDLITDNNGVFYLTWPLNNEDNIHNHIYLQKFDSNGDLLLEESESLHWCEGVKTDPKMIITSDNNLVVCWKEDWDSNDIVSAKYDLDTLDQIEFNHIIHCQTETSSVKLVPDSEGGFWATWIQLFDDYDLHVQHMTSYLTKTIDYFFFVASNQEGPFQSTLFITENNQALIGWFDETNLINSLNMQKVNDVGDYQFSDPITIQQGYCSNSEFSKLVLVNNEPLIFWSEYDSYPAKSIFIQKLDEDGSLQFAGNGKPILGTSDLSADELQAAVSGNITVVVSKNNLNGWNQTIAQAIDENGNELWGDEGKRLSYSSAENVAMNISSKDGYFYAGWTEASDTSEEVLVQKLDIDGNLLWQNSGVVIEDDLGVNRFVDTVGECFVWSHIEQNYSKVLIQKLDENGAADNGWPEDGLEIINYVTFLSKITVTEVDNNYLIVWAGGPNGEENLYGQLVSDNGELLWSEDGIILAPGGSSGSEYSVYYDEYIYLCYNTANSPVLKLQKINLAGESLLQEDGLTLGNGSNPHVVRLNNQMITVWEKVDEELNRLDIFAQLLDLEGDIQWNEGGEPICSNPFQQENLQVIANDSNDLFVSWIDYRNFENTLWSAYNRSIFAQKIHLDPLFTPEETLAAIQTSLHQNYPNPFNPSTVISFSLTTELTEDTEIEIYNVKGQKIVTLSAPMQSECIEGRQGQATYSTTWHGNDQSGNPVASGVYFYKLNVENSPIKKMVLLK